MAQDGNGIEVEGLIRDFKGGVRAVDGIDLQVTPGEIYGFLGPNGAGKSTTVLVLTTLLPPTAGSARVAGLDVVHQGAEVRRAIGASLQESALDPYLTSSEHNADERRPRPGDPPPMRGPRHLTAALLIRDARARIAVERR
jgi:ABC-2 type transport system ATP-binding protein